MTYLSYLCLRSVIAPAVAKRTTPIATNVVAMASPVCGMPWLFPCLWPVLLLLDELLKLFELELELLLLDELLKLFELELELELLLLDELFKLFELLLLDELLKLFELELELELLLLDELI